jgi:hypothetical protein
MDSFSEVAKGGNETFVLGRAIADLLGFPPRLLTLAQSVATIGDSGPRLSAAIPGPQTMGFRQAQLSVGP